MNGCCYLFYCNVNLQRPVCQTAFSFLIRNTATIYIPLYLQGIAVPTSLISSKYWCEIEYIAKKSKALLAVFWFWINRKYDFGAAVAQEVNGHAPIERLEV